MYKDIISYKLADGVTEEKLLNIAGQIVKDWMSKQSGFVKWEINKNNEGNYTDIVYWKTKEDAKKSEKNMVNIPNAGEWFGCYKEGTIVSQNLEKLSEFGTN